MCDYLCDCNYYYYDNTDRTMSCFDYIQCSMNSIVNCLCCIPIWCYGYYSTDPYQFTVESFNRLEDRYILCADLFLLCKYSLCRCCYDINRHEYNSLHGAAISGNYLYFYWLNCCCISYDVDSNNIYHDGSLLHLTYSYRNIYNDDHDDTTTTSSPSSPPSSFSIHNRHNSSDNIPSSQDDDSEDDNDGNVNGDNVDNNDVSGSNSNDDNNHSNDADNSNYDDKGENNHHHQDEKDNEGNNHYSNRDNNNDGIAINGKNNSVRKANYNESYNNTANSNSIDRGNNSKSGPSVNRYDSNNIRHGSSGSSSSSSSGTSSGSRAYTTDTHNSGHRRGPTSSSAIVIHPKGRAMIRELLLRKGANPLIKNKYGEFPADIAIERDLHLDSDYVKQQIFKHIVYKEAKEKGLPLELYAAYEDLMYHDIIEEIKQKKLELKTLLNTQLRVDQTNLCFDNSHDLSLLSKRKDLMEKSYHQRYINLYLPKQYSTYSLIQKHSYVRKELTNYMLKLIDSDDYDLLDKVKTFKMEFIQWSEPKYIEASAPPLFTDGNNGDSNGDHNSEQQRARVEDNANSSNAVSHASYEINSQTINSSSNSSSTNGLNQPMSNNTNDDELSYHHHHHHQPPPPPPSQHSGYPAPPHDRHYNHTAPVPCVYNRHGVHTYEQPYITTTATIAYVVNDDDSGVNEETVGLLDSSFIDRKRQLLI